MADLGKRIQRGIGVIDRWQQRRRAPAVIYGVVKKFGDDDTNLLVVALGWYGFTAIYPLLLVVVTVFGFIGTESLGTGIVHTLHQFPVIGTEFNPGRGGAQLHGSVAGLIIGVVGLVYGAQGVTQIAEKAMARVWNVPQTRLPGFLPRLGRSLAGLAAIGGAFLVNAVLAPLATSHGLAWYGRILIVAGMLAANCGFYFLAFRVLTPGGVASRALLPGSIFAAVGFTVLITVGAGLVQHQLRQSSATYGAFAAVIGLVTFLLLLSKLSLYAAELNSVVTLGLWPRALPTCPPTRADDRQLRALVLEQQRRPDQRIDVCFEGTDTAEAAEGAAAGNGAGRTHDAQETHAARSR